ncbi:VOC family protein [uncultured Methylobacterium sp.]|uniref:VOC family protein n=1 Tax=uncultured Methylobacterium sp. TaxID=157278 RepID=UPI0035C95295
MSARVRAVVGIERTVSDLARTEAFYRDGLGFARIGPPEPVPPPVLQAFGLPDAAATRLTMRLGDQRIGFLAFDPPGAPYPDAPCATDPFFQHAAIPVRDMDAAFAHLSAAGPGAISVGGPQTLPPDSGGVTAYKFRDPDGHPLELIVFPGGPPAERWRGARGLFLGIDHSAITVTDRAAALAFYGDRLGLAVAQRGVNRGEGQARLDGVPDPVVDVIALEPTGAATPHVELLHYRCPMSARPRPAAFGPRDRATTRFVLAVEDAPETAAAIRAAGYPARVSADGSTAYAEGPDGRGLLLVAS